MPDQEGVERNKAAITILLSATTGPGNTAARVCAASVTTNSAPRRRPLSASTRTSPRTPMVSARIAALGSTMLGRMLVGARRSLSESESTRKFSAWLDGVEVSGVKNGTLVVVEATCLVWNRMIFN